jgi:ABC-type cobalamin/Fe3+-siderophores transport system ATPase subunit
MSLSIKNLSVVRNNKHLISNFSYCFDEGNIYALVGNNGSGKTTLLKTLAGLLNTYRGNILLEGHDLILLSEKMKANIISFLLQQSPEQPYCTAINRIAHGLMPTFGYDFLPKDKTFLMIEDIAKKLNIYHLLHRRLSQMSGGEQRLVHIAKCLVNSSTKIVLLDEPSVYLDFTQQNNLGENLQRKAHNGQLIIFSSHDARFIERFAHKTMTIENKQIHISHNRG